MDSQKQKERQEESIEKIQKAVPRSRQTHRHLGEQDLYRRFRLGGSGWDN